MKIKTDVIINEKLWKKDPNISKKIKALIKEIAPQTPLICLPKAEVSVLLTDDQQIQELNQNYRHKNKPTNVLSFALLNSKKIKNGNFKKLNLSNEYVANEYIALGDIVISYQTILKEAAEQNKTFEHHLTHLLIHSLLHLIGFDHINKKDAKIMEDLEIKILAKMGIKNPYVGM